MIILQDTREQAPLQWEIAGAVEEVRVETLPVGDYACEFSDGSRPPVVFERKDLNDLFGTMGKGYRRFKKELAKAAESGIVLILIVEVSLSRVLGGHEYSSMSGQTVLRKLMTLWVRYNLMPVFCRNRPEAAVFIRETFEAIGRNYTKHKKEAGRDQRKITKGKKDG